MRKLDLSARHNATMMQVLAVGHKTALTSDARTRPSSWWRRQTASTIRCANQRWQTAFTDLIVIG